MALTPYLLESVVQRWKPNSRSRQIACQKLQRLADFANIKNRQDNQLALFEGEETSIIDSTEASRNLANKRLMEEAKKRGGTARIYPAINASAIQEMLGESPDQLYDALGIPQSDRSRLPQVAGIGSYAKS